MLIYRIEHKETKEGPYNCSLLPYNAKWKRGDHYDKKHPTILGEHKDKIKSKHNIKDFDDIAHKYKFAFKDIYQLKKWFHPQEIVKLYQYNFVIRRYRVNKKAVLFANKQLLIKYDCLK